MMRRLCRMAARPSQRAFATRPLYLDSQSTTQLDPRVLDAMLPLETETYGNMHSRTHAYGWEATDMVENARAQLASLIGASPNELIFTSGATESNNMAVKGVARFAAKSRKKKNHIITTVTVRASRHAAPTITSSFFFSFSFFFSSCVGGALPVTRALSLIGTRCATSRSTSVCWIRAACWSKRALT